jgi:hypothetical protein
MGLDLVVFGLIFVIVCLFGVLMVCLSVGLHQNELEKKIDLILEKLRVTPDEQTSKVR